MRLQKRHAAELRSILTHPSVFSTAKDDGVTKGQKLDYKKMLNKAIWLRPRSGVLFAFSPRNHITYEMHVAILEDKRKGAVKDAEEASRWMFKVTPCQKIITAIPSTYESCIMFAQVCGMKREGLSPKSFLKDKELLDCVLLGATKEEFIQLYGEV